MLLLLVVLLACCLLVSPPLVAASKPAAAAAPSAGEDEPAQVNIPRRIIGVPPPMPPAKTSGARAAAPVPPAQEAAPAAASADEAAHAKPVAAEDGHVRNDQTTHVSYSADNTETHCDRTGDCEPCSEDDKLSSACQPTGFHQLVTCRVLAPEKHSDAAASLETSGAQPVLRSYTQRASCELSETGAASFWLFELLCVASACTGAWVMKKRQRVVMSLHHRRMDRLVNS